MNGQRPLFSDPPTDPIWKCDQLRRMAAEGYYWTPDGPRNGPYVAPAKEQQEREPQRARPHRVQPSRKTVLA